MSFVARGGTKIHFTDTGGTGPAVVLGHSLLMDQEMFEPQRSGLGQEYRIIAIDSRGHGPSEDDGTPFSYWDLARDAWAVVDHLAVDQVVVGGIEDGAAIAMRMALLAPPRVRGVIVSGSTAGAISPQRQVGYREVLEYWAGDGPLTPTIKMVSALTIGGTIEDKQPWWNKWLTGDRSRIKLATQCLLNRDSVLELLADITCPAMVLHGSSDQATSPEEAAEMAAAFGGPTTVHSIAGAAMVPTLTHPEVVNELLRDFLAGLP